MKRIIGALATGGSIIGLTAIPGTADWLQIIIGIIGFISFCYLVCDDYFHNKKRNERTYYSEAEVREAMQGLIKTQGKVCVMSRALSWVDETTEKIMEKKKQSLLVFAEKENDVTKKLIDKGIDVRYYGEYKFQPKTRFSVIGYNLDKPQVAISIPLHTIRKKNSYKHTIYETTPNSDNMYDSWITSLALDMISLCDLATARKETKNEAN